MLSVLLLSGCVGRTTVQPDDEIQPGQALGFDFIHYVSTSEQGGSLFQKVLDIEADGRMPFSSGLVSLPPEPGPIRYLRDRQLLDVRVEFSESRFFEFADTEYGDPQQQFEKQSIVYQVDGVSEQIVRYGNAPVPASIEPLFDRLESLIEESERFGEGTELGVTELVAGQQSQIESREFVVIKNQDALLNLLWRVGSIEISVLPRVDFSQEMLACAFLGDDAGRTAAIEFDDVGYLDGNAINIRYRRLDFVDGCDRESRPYAFVRLPRSALRVEFYEDPQPLRTQPCR